MKKLLLLKALKTLINAFIAGLLIGLFGLGYLLVGGILGTLFLGAGFLVCMLYGYENFLIKLPYITENKIPYILETIITFIGNMLGAVIIALLLKLTDINSVGAFSETSMKILDTMTSFNRITILIFSIFSSMLIYFGVNTYKKAEQPLARFLVLFICVTVSSLLGMYMVTYNMFVFTVLSFQGNLWSYFFTILGGNIIGAIIVPLLRKLRSKING